MEEESETTTTWKSSKGLRLQLFQWPWVRAKVTQVRALTIAMIQGRKRLVLEMQGLKDMVLQKLAQDQK
jgi:hypothetical protein